MPRSRRVFIKTFGCQMNVYDTERMYRLAELKGYTRSETAEEADLIIINSCTVREKPEHKAVSEVGWMDKRARAHKDVKIVLAGCAAQRLGEGVLKKLPAVDLVLGTGAINQLAELIPRIEAGERIAACQISDESEIGMSEMCNGPGREGPEAFVSIMRGCDNYCSYCIVPYVRGPEKSRRINEIVTEVSGLVEKGVREVTLLGQNVNSYGKRLSGDVDFVTLLEAVHEIEGLARIRFTTSHPKDLSLRLIDAFGRLPKLAGHIHLPVQSGSDAVIKRMNRKYTIGQYEEKLAALRKVRPGIGLTSDMIVGFCGESDDDFQKTLDLMNRVRYDNLFSFMYSPREGTAAAKLDDDVPLDVKKKRLDILQDLQKKITLENNQAKVGNVEELLVGGSSRGGPDRRWGRTSSFHIVHFDDPDAKPGDLVQVRIDAAYQNALVGTVVKTVS